MGDADSPIVELSADGVLPEPVVGVLDAPPRIYLDLRDVTPAPAVPVGPLGVVTRVRVGTHSVSPLLTRVVIDLRESRGYRLDTSQRRAGVIRISIVPADPTRSRPSVRSTPGAIEPSNRRSHASPRARGSRGSMPPPDELQTPAPPYQARIRPIITQLQSVRSVLQAIDQRTNVPAERLDTAAQTIAAVQAQLAAVRVTGDAVGVHDALRSVCTLGAMAVALGRTANGTDVPLNAASAAAGALLLFDRAEAALRPR